MNDIMEIKIGDEYKIKVEEDLSNSIFKDVYEQAAECVEDIMLQSENLKRPTNLISEVSYNNIVAFTGERGTGKSSSMISFANELVREDGFYKKKDNSKYEQIRSKKLGRLEVIDPSLFRNGDKLFEIIISEMFSKFQKKINSDQNSISQNDKRELITLFQNVFNNLKVLHSDKSKIYEKESIEALSDLAYGTHLYKTFFDLVKKYLQVVDFDADFLLIMIDDFDLNIEGAHSMLEDIRQFLIQKNIIILMAFRMEQLQDSIRLEIVEKYDPLLKNPAKELDGYYLEDLPKSKAEKYLEKLFPKNRTIPIQNVFLTKKIDFIIRDQSQDEPLVKSNSVQEGVLELIYRKTKVFIPKAENSVNAFVPTTLRELINFVSMVNKINNVDRYQSYLESKKTEYLPFRELNIFDSFNLYTSDLNQFIIQWMSEDIQFRGMRRFTNATNSLNCSFGDVLHVYNKYLEQLNLIQYESLKKLKYILVLYNIKNQFKYENEDSRWTIFSNELINEHAILFRKDIQGNLRNRFEFNGLNRIIENIEKVDDFVWISCLIPMVGKTNSDHRYEDELLFENKLNFGKTIFKHATFNILNFISALANTKVLFQRSQKPIIEKSELYKELLSWNSDVLILFTNVFFIRILLDELRQSADNFKESLPNNYGDTIQKYIIDGFTTALRRIDESYPHLHLQSSGFMENPFFIYWEKNSQQVNKILNEIFDNQRKESKYSKHEINLAKSLLAEKQRYFDPDGDYSPRGAKQAMNTVVKSWPEDSEQRFQLHKYRELMDMDLREGLEEIESYLKQIV